MPNLPMPDGVEMTDLECVMLEVAPFNVEAAMGDAFSENDLFYGDHPNLEYAQGMVGETNPHLTLLFGIHPSDDYEMNVYLALDGWDLPDIMINEIGFFPSRIEGQDYVCIVAHVAQTAPLMAGNARLKELPHTDNFPNYLPHIALAYIKGSADKEEWLFRLNAAFGHKFVKPLALDLGND